MGERVGDEVLYELRDAGIVVVTLNRPDKRNAVDAAVTRGITDAVRRSEEDPDVRVVVLTSSDARVFCAGADLGATREGGMVTPGGGFAGFVDALRRKPWIAAVRGWALAGGLELCLACDMIVAGEDAQLGLPEPKRGLIAGAGGATRLPRMVPQVVANEMITTGDPIDGMRAYALGLVNQAVPSEEVLDAALELARRVAANAPLSVQEGLALSRDAGDLHPDEARAATEAALARLRTTADFVEGPRAFLEKRPPVWVGR
jgi:enoyl-CoA hydratase/carnithine racemase